MSEKSQTSTAGIKPEIDGDHIIPASTRADGTLRKEIKVKPGYKPPEEVEVYKNRTAEAWKSRGSSAVPGAEPMYDNTQETSKTSNKNAKRREARKKAKTG